MKNLLRSGFCLLIAALAFASCTQAFASPVGAHYEKHQSVKPGKVTATVHQLVAQISYEIAMPAVLPVKVASVPKTKVYCLKKYFGMTVGSDISHHYRRAKITMVVSNYGFYLSLPPLLSFS